METFLAVVGGILIVGIVSFILIVSLSALIDRIKLMFASMKYNASKIARQELGQRIALDSHWFSENKEVMLAVRILGEAINQNHDGVYNVCNVRDTWEDKIKESNNA